VSQQADAAVSNPPPATADTEIEQPGAAGDSEPPARRQASWLARRWVPLALVLGFLVHVAWRVWLARDLAVPAAHADEDGYLIAARVLAGGPGGATMDNPAFRRSGYPLLISPVYWFTQDPFVVYRAVLIFNAIVNALVFPLLYVFGRRALRLAPPAALGGAFAAAALPAVVFYTQYALTDAVLSTIVMLWLVLVYQWLGARTARGRLLGGLGAGAAAGLLYAVHVRGMMVLVVQVLLVAVLLLLRRVRWPAALAALAGAVLVALLDPLLKVIIGDRIVMGGQSPTSDTIDAVTTLSGLERMFSIAQGQLWYLCMATFGLGAVGVIAAVGPLLRPRRLRDELVDPDRSAPRVVLTTALVTMALVALSAGAALPPDEGRLNFYAYPRYIQVFFPLWLIVGLAALLTAGDRRRMLRLALGGAALTVVTGAYLWLRLRIVGYGEFVAFDAPEMTFMGWRWKEIGVLRPTIAALLLMAGIVVLLLRPRRGLPVALAGIVLVAATNMVFAHEKISKPWELAQYKPGTPKLVKDGYVQEGEVVAYAKEQFLWSQKFTHSREVYWAPLLYFDATKDPVPAQADVVIAPYDPPSYSKADSWDGTGAGFTLVVEDPNNHWAVWRRDRDR
jgi:hypothetical protein